MIKILIILICMLMSSCTSAKLVKPAVTVNDNRGNGDTLSHILTVLWSAGSNPERYFMPIALITEASARFKHENGRWPSNETELLDAEFDYSSMEPEEKLDMSHIRNLSLVEKEDGSLDIFFTTSINHDDPESKNITWKIGVNNENLSNINIELIPIIGDSYKPKTDSSQIYNELNDILNDVILQNRNINE